MLAGKVPLPGLARATRRPGTQLPAALSVRHRSPVAISLPWLGGPVRSCSKEACASSHLRHAGETAASPGQCHCPWGTWTSPPPRRPSPQQGWRRPGGGWSRPSRASSERWGCSCAQTSLLLLSFPSVTLLRGQAAKPCLHAALLSISCAGPRGTNPRADVLIKGHLSNTWLRPHRDSAWPQGATPALARWCWPVGALQRGGSPTHLKQCAAVRTQLGSMMLPPQMCSFLYRRLTCQGQALMAAGLPPSTRGVLVLSPQPSAGRRSSNKATR